MKRTLVTLFIGAVSLLIVSDPLFGHHGTSAFENGETVTMKASVTEWIWSNPHCLLRFDAKDDNGRVVHWIAETQAPINMIPSGWSKKSFKPGDEISIAVIPAKGGRPVAAIEWVVLPNGKTLKARAAVDNRPYANQK